MDTPTNYDDDMFFDLEDEDVVVPTPLRSLVPAEDPPKAAPAVDPDKPAEAAGGRLLPDDTEAEYILNVFLKAYGAAFGEDGEGMMKSEIARLYQLMDAVQQSHQDDPDLWKSLEDGEKNREFLLSLTADDVASVTGDDADKLRAEFEKASDDERYDLLMRHLSIDEFHQLWTAKHSAAAPAADEIADLPDKYVAVTSNIVNALQALGSPEDIGQTWKEGKYDGSFKAINEKKRRGRPKKGASPKYEITPEVNTDFRLKWNASNGINLNWKVDDSGMVIINGKSTMLRASAISGDIFGSEEIKIYNGICSFFVDSSGGVLPRCRIRLSDLCSHLKGSRKTTREYRQFVWNELLKISIPEITIDCTKEMEARGLKDDEGFSYRKHIKSGPFIDLSRNIDYLETDKNFDIVFSISSTPVILAYSAIPEIHQYTSHPARLMEIHEVRNGKITDAKISSTDRREKIRGYLFEQVSWMKNTEGKRFSNRIRYDSIFADADASASHSASHHSAIRDREYIHDVLEYWKADGFISSYKFIWPDRSKGKYSIFNDPEGSHACAVDIFISD